MGNIKLSGTIKQTKLWRCNFEKKNSTFALYRDDFLPIILSYNYR